LKKGAAASLTDNTGLCEQYGHLLARLGRPEEAEAASRGDMELAPNAVGPVAGLSHTLARLGRHHEVITAIDAAIEIERIHPGSTAEAITLCGRPDPAVASYAR
jgi:hypothetical protein